MTGFGKDPTNPFSNNISATRDSRQRASNPMYSGNRQAPLFEFAANRLILDPTQYHQCPSNISRRSRILRLAGQFRSPAATINFYAYFSAYGNGGYDPNDVNFAETDAAGIVANAGVPA